MYVTGLLDPRAWIVGSFCSLFNRARDRRLGLRGPDCCEYWEISGRKHFSRHRLVSRFEGDTATMQHIQFIRLSMARAQIDGHAGKTWSPEERAIRRDLAACYRLV